VQPPEWYLTLVAAKRLNCTPWEIDDDPDGWPYTWRARAFMANDCEGEVERAQARRANRPGQFGRR
jgi:hypothetical protein